MLDPDELALQLRKLVSSITRIDVSELSPEVRVREELGIDSLVAMEIVAACEKHFDIQIDEEQLLEIETVGEFYNLVATILKDKSD
jgi:acyl carrier protein